MKFLFKFIGRRKIAAFLIGALLLSVFDLAGIAIIFPYLKLIAEPEVIDSHRYLRAFYEIVGFNSHEQFMYAVSFCLLVFFSLKTICILLLNKLQYKGLAEIAHRLTTELFGMLMTARYDFFLRRAPSELLGMNYSYSSQVVLSFQAWLGIVNEFIFFMLFFCISVYVQPLATMIIAGGIILIVVVLYLLIIKRIVRYGKQQNLIDAARHRWTYATVSSIKDAKIMGLGNTFYERTEELSEKTREIAWRNSFASALPRVSIEYVMITAFIFAAVLFMRSGISMEKMLPVLGLMALSALRALPAFGRLTGYYSTFRYSRNYLDKLAEFHSTLAQSRQEIVHLDIPFEKKIEIEHLRFSYPDKEIISDLSITIRKGQSVGIVGASGSGKSTLLDVITGLQEKAGGRFLLDDIEVDPYSSDAIRRYVGYVPQQIALIDESIAFNVTFTHDYDRSKLNEVLKVANLSAFVDALPEGVDTSVGEAGVRLSGGQKQRLGIARALYRDPQILIFDESTSALDNITEKELSDEIQALAGNKTLIIVAHRLTTIMHCDVIYVMQDGKIVASGKHAELLQNSSLYRAMNLPGEKNESNDQS
ncbi:ABC-type bacteriocin/lantibiotic exporter [Herbaspirillum sp. CF444]|uniref:ABC transporter ATP-binding protein n=1 Tax=Herbaspirillum sp. CF444 TaxID=1144319 RepID=UPI0002723443|nr:ABC transporter ATP-binding protein [Herbaspirillum sp. CF444]EJL81437.1 ABC-type bacteriocin/lantibiotic exporter [Herbaspirillum sp. CF444]